MNAEKKIAQAILDAQKMREESYYFPTGDVRFRGYKLDIETCLIKTCKQQGLSENLWALLDLAMHWWNDIQLWAEDVLAGKNILDECEKENAEMKDDMKRVGDIADKEQIGRIPFGETALKMEVNELKRTGEIVDKIVADDAALSEELIRMNDKLKTDKAQTFMDRVGGVDDDGLEKDT